MATRAAMHRAGAAVLGELLSSSETAPRQVPCGCGEQATYHDSRPKQLTTVVGEVCFQRAYYVCPRCRQGQSPRDAELDVAGTRYSPGVRRMMAVVGSETSFAQGGEQLVLLAGLEVTAKAAERQAEILGADIAGREQVEMERAKQLELPQVCAPAVPVLYIEMDGTGVPVVAAETQGRSGKTADQPARTREVKLGCVFTQTSTDEQGRRRLLDLEAVAGLCSIFVGYKLPPARRPGGTRATAQWHRASRHDPFPRRFPRVPDPGLDSFW
jgi:hypothetical protein